MDRKLTAVAMYTVCRIIIHKQYFWDFQ